MSKQNTVNIVRQLITETVVTLGYSIWDIEYVKEGAVWYLRITIDSPQGIGIDDCEAVYRSINPILDQGDPIEAAYILEVGSPGVERVLRTDEHYAACLGEVITVKLFKALDGAKEFVGTLSVAENDSITLEIDSQPLKLEKSAISKANVYYDFEN